MEKKFSFLFIHLILSIFYQTESCNAAQLMMGSISFPKQINTIPPVRIYAGGLKLSTEIDPEAKKIIFSVPKSRTNQCYILITEKIYPAQHKKPKSKKNNTIAYLRINPQQPYKLYSLELISKPKNDEPSKIITLSGAGAPTGTGSAETQELLWDIQEQSINEQGKIPDQTIIVLSSPDFIECLQGGSEFELPTIALKKNLLTLLGSEDKFIALANALILDSIDADTIHSSLHHKIAFDEQRHCTIILPTA